MRHVDTHTAAAFLNGSSDRYRLILLAARRAREIEQGAAPRVQVNGDKPLGIALREIAEGMTS